MQKKQLIILFSELSNGLQNLQTWLLTIAWYFSKYDSPKPILPQDSEILVHGVYGDRAVEVGAPWQDHTVSGRPSSIWVPNSGA